jgi:hypothetical protein
MAMQRYWRRNPPVHVLVAGFMGYGKDASGPAAAPPSDFSEGDATQASPAHDSNVAAMLGGFGLQVPHV